MRPQLPFRVHGLSSFASSLHAGLIVSSKLLQAQPQGQIHEGLLVRALLHYCLLDASLAHLVLD